MSKGSVLLHCFVQLGQTSEGWPVALVHLGLGEVIEIPIDETTAPAIEEAAGQALCGEDWEVILRDISLDEVPGGYLFRGNGPMP